MLTATRREPPPPAVAPCPLRPLAGWCIIRKVGPPKKTPGGLLLPDDWKRRKRGSKAREGDPFAGVVEAVGPGKRLKDGTFAPANCAVGDKVVWKWYTDSKSWTDGAGRLWWIVEQDDVLVVVEQGAEIVTV